MKIKIIIKIKELFKKINFLKIKETVFSFFNKLPVKKIFRKMFFLSVKYFLLILLITFAINRYMISFSKKYIYKSVENIPQRYAVIVPGARVYSNNISYVVRDRVEGAAECIKKNKAQRVLISGDHGRKNYDEVNQMRKYMQKIYDIDKEIIFMDHAGFSTYETMYRARDIFCVDGAIIVTQEFHTVRSVYIARKLGLDVVAYEAPELNPFSKRIHTSWNLREYFARVKSFFLVACYAKPTYLGEKIPITGSAFASWDVIE